MKRFLAGLLLSCMMLTGAAGQEPEPLAPSPDSEMKEATEHLLSYEYDDRNYLRYFTTYAIPEEIKIGDEVLAMRSLAEKTLPFVLNSCANFNAYAYITRPKRVAGSSTLWYVDIRDFGWSIDDLDTIFRYQPYFLSPLVDSYNNVILFRADWLIVNAMDATKQNDRGIKDIAYYILQYGKGNEPKNADDFRKAWLVDIDTIRVHKLETGSVVDAGDSGVSKHTRQLRRGRTLAGYYWETRDVKSHDIDPQSLKSRDFIEDIFADQYDASELIASMKNGLQAYLLTLGPNNNNQVIHDADAGVVSDKQDPHDPRVRTAKSCVVCHLFGIIPYTNAIKDFFRDGGDIKTYEKQLAQEIRAFYLKNDGSEVEEDNAIYARAVKECNGLEPDENMKAFRAVYDWYWNVDVTLEQAALECGLSVEEYKKEIKGVTTGRLAKLYKGQTMTREIWDSVNAGGYVQSMLLIKRIGKMPPDKQGGEDDKVLHEVVIAKHQAPLYKSGDQILVYLGSGLRVNVLRDHDEHWYWAQWGKYRGYLRKSHTRTMK